MNEFNYLVAAVRADGRPPEETWQRLGLDGAKLAHLADKHAVTPLLYGILDSPSIQQRVRKQALFNLTLSAELRRLVTAFTSQGVRMVPLKGPVLNQLLYGTQSRRMSADLDILVHPNDVLRARDIMLSLRYRMESLLHWPSDSACLRTKERELSFSDPTDRVSVDMHWRLIPPYFPAPLHEPDVWRRLNHSTWEGVPVWTLAPEDLLLFLSAHGAKHMWLRLGWICDIAQLVKSHPDLNWAEVYAQSDRTGTSWIPTLALLLAHEWLGAPIPPDAAPRVSQDDHAHALAPTVGEWLRSGSTPSAAQSLRFFLRAFPRPGQRARLIWGVFFHPTQAEYKVLQLPPALHFLYYPFRLLRLCLKRTISH